MNKYKYSLVTTFSSLVAFFVMPLSVSAQTVGLINPSRYNSLEEVILAGLSLLQPVVVLVFVGMVLYGGWTYLTSQGEPDKIKQAKQIITAAIVGFAIIVIAPSIVQLVASLLGVNPNLVRVT
jgi:hypothetical protein